MKHTALRDKQVVLLGLGRFGGGVAAAEYLAHQGVRLTVLDEAEPESLADSLHQIASLPLTDLRLGTKALPERLEADLLVVNPAVPPQHPLVRSARERGIPVTTEVALFLKACPAKVVGVTGTNGKSSTTSMVAHLLGRCFEEESSPRRVYIGGNLGGSLLDRLPEIAPSDWVVLELSSFQLHYFDASIPRPSIVVLTPCVANHLNWHGSMEHYIGSKQKIFASRGTSQFLVCDPTASGAATRDLPEGVLPLQTVSAEHLGCLASLGAHQVRNAQLAVPAAMAVGRVEALCNVQGRLEKEVEEEEKINSWVSRFSGWSPPPMRLQPIGMLRRHPLFNDSASTTPESSEAAATALPGGWFLIGGADKGANYDSLIRTLALQAKGAAFFGTIGPSLFRIMRRRFPTFPTFCHQGFQKGLRWILEHAESEEPVVFSPGCAGWDQFLHYRRRGEIFEEFVSRLPFFTGP